MASTELDWRPSRLNRPSRLRGALAPAEWWRLGSMVAVIVALHLVGWITLVLIVDPERFSLGGKAFGVGVGLTAYTLGMRHAFDADHIAAIDNTTRKLMSDGQRPLAVGFFFSLGHSTVVFALALLLATGTRAVIKATVGPVEDDSSALHHYTGLIGTSVSGVFLYLIAILNVIVLVGILRVFLRLRRGEYDETELERHLQNRGLINRFLGRFTRSITKSWHLYPVGLLFGLGFDTATEIALLVLAGTSAAAGLPWYAILCLPVLFTAGMCLLDTIDGSFMNFAYGWAFASPVRKIYYNITITGLSVAVALLIGTVELLGLFADQLGWRGPFWRWLGGIDLNTVGFVVVGIFVATWAVALLVWRYGRIEEKWSSARS
ncbi:HoxN/HupN/NixA family nickel/cobalt transporter [Mycobacterium paraense]|uniref:HoxN/HupN/NixA family nickel/cobalt transporter n=1 Tax=Mycobacterium paraense TaxID=767916 RepID=UPI000A16A3D0|nr:HoxN/HupN/NixA family nickel/cobalt transporter [Mycobacterium paraense]MCV7441916.1 HoxN/HupN/NixA family nickel/cobalt transporter [Mycobacterium paraense]ORW41123.1 nickel transporter [Mycobacterium paraense]